MKILLDQGLPRTAARLLRDRGHDALHVADVGMSAAEDAAIIAYARAAGFLVVTLDADFHAILATTTAEGPSVIRLRVEGMAAEPLAAMIHRVCALTFDDLTRGAMVTVDPHRLRVRLLPHRSLE